MHSVEPQTASVYRKKTPEYAIEAEVAMARAAHRLYQQSSLCMAPDVIAVERHAGEIIFESLPAHRTIAELMIKGKPVDNHVARAGSALAMAHEQLKPELLIQVPESVPRNQAGRESFLHGDFTIDNIVVDVQSGEIWIVDWSLAPWLSAAGNHGPPLWDVCWMLLSVFMLHPLRISRRLRLTAAQSFLSAYREVSAKNFERDELVSYGYDVATLVERLIHQHLQFSRPLMLWGVRNYRRWLRHAQWVAK